MVRRGRGGCVGGIGGGGWALTVVPTLGEAFGVGRELLVVETDKILLILIVILFLLGVIYMVAIIRVGYCDCGQLRTPQPSYLCHFESALNRPISATLNYHSFCFPDLNNLSYVLNVINNSHEVFHYILNSYSTILNLCHKLLCFCIELFSQY